MGIRYFALPVPAPLVSIAKINPRAFLSEQHFWELWSDPPDRPEGLYLDKCRAAIMGGRRDDVESSLEAARKFTVQLAGMGLGLIYSIG